VPLFGTLYWLDDLTDWSGMKLPELVWAAEEQVQYRQIVDTVELPTLMTEYSKLSGDLIWRDEW